MWPFDKKMKSVSRTYRYIASSLAFLILVTSLGFSINIHYCQGRLQSVSLIGTAKSCCELAAATLMKNCPNHEKLVVQDEGCSLDKKKCCENQAHRIQSDQDQQAQSYDFVVGKQLQQFVVAFVAVFARNTFTVEADAISFAHYKPPVIPKDIPVLFQSFLI